MWARTASAAFRSARLRPQRTNLFSRSYNGANQGAPKTYFQEPPNRSRRILWRLVKGTALFGSGFYIHAYLHEALKLDVQAEDFPVIEEALALELPKRRRRLCMH
jgi:hypothetical protein